MYKPIKYNPTKIKPLKSKNKKNQRYWQTNLKPLGDADKDGKVNVMDCYPYNANRQGLAEVKEGIVSVGKKARKKIMPTEEEQIEKVEKELKVKAETPSYAFLIIKAGGKWFNQGAFTTDNIETVLRQIKTQPGVEDAFISTNPKEADALNRQLMVQKPIQRIKEMKGELTEGETAQALKRYGARKKVEFAKHAKEGLKFKQGQPEARIVRRSSGRPPPSTGWWGSPAYERQRIPRPSGPRMSIQQPVEEKEQNFEMEDMDTFPSQFQEPPRKLPPNVQRYAPVSKQEAFLSYRPVGRQARREETRTSRPGGLIPIVTFKPVKFKPLYFGRRLRK